jgi:hypothetical protein
MFVLANQNTNTQGYLAYALWNLFNPSALNGLSSSQLAGVDAWLSKIPKGLIPSQFANFFIYTPALTKSITCGRGNCPTAPPQEFLGFSEPEGGAAMLYLLLAAASCLGAIVLRHRRQANGMRPMFSEAIRNQSSPASPIPRIVAVSVFSTGSSAAGTFLLPKGGSAALGVAFSVRAGSNN